MTLSELLSCIKRKEPPIWRWTLYVLTSAVTCFENRSLIPLRSLLFAPFRCLCITWYVHISSKTQSEELEFFLHSSIICLFGIGFLCPLEIRWWPDLSYWVPVSGKSGRCSDGNKPDFVTSKEWRQAENQCCFSLRPSHMAAQGGGCPPWRPSCP